MDEEEDTSGRGGDTSSEEETHLGVVDNSGREGGYIWEGWEHLWVRRKTPFDEDTFLREEDLLSKEDGTSG